MMMVLNSLGNKITITSWSWVNRRLRQEGVIMEAINMMRGKNGVGGSERKDSESFIKSSSNGYLTSDDGCLIIKLK